MSDQTTLNMTLSNGEFLGSLREHIQAIADQDEQALGRDTQWGKRHVSALHTLYHYLAGLGNDDQRIVALSQVTMAVFGSRQYKPTDLQVRLLARLGQTDVPPSSADTLEELVAASAFDVIATLASVRAEAAEAQRRREEKEAELLSVREALATAETDLMAARDEIVSLTEERKELQEQVTTLRQWVGDGEVPGEKADSKPTRKKLEGHDYIYTRDTADGPLYIVRVPLPEGKSKYETIGPDLEEALAKRSELVPGFQKEKVPA